MAIGCPDLSLVAEAGRAAVSQAGETHDSLQQVPQKERRNDEHNPDNDSVEDALQHRLDVRVALCHEAIAQLATGEGHYQLPGTGKHLAQPRLGSDLDKAGVIARCTAQLSKAKLDGAIPIEAPLQIFRMPPHLHLFHGQGILEVVALNMWHLEHVLGINDRAGPIGWAGQLACYVAAPNLIHAEVAAQAWNVELPGGSEGLR
mmetsp:Transcript_37597/g.88415  ORF Transcript_37597/g.88415 Transcript_37597/m.88415 type:complete len:203 (+) Transcript_37597:89-697(+)